MQAKTAMISRSAISAACLICGLMLPAGALWGQAIPHNQDAPPGPPLSPEEAVAKMKVPPGFKVEIVASEPAIVNPVAMAFDERGRIWITESLEYPRREAGPGRDRVKILEDVDGDGRFEKVTVFAEGLNIPSGIAIGHGGVWVANAPDILLLRDTDGDGRADAREVVVTGFGRHDTHELPNSLTWGPDGWLYGLNGVFNPARIAHQGQEHVFTCAMFRIHPRTRAFELFAEGTSNPWGIAFDPWGSAFVSACVIDHLWHIVETGYYHRQAGAYPPHTWKIESIVNYKHQKAAYCGLHYFDSDAYPPQYAGRLYMGNIHGGCINVDRLERAGATYRGQPEPDFLVANDAWFMPVAQKTGPDGCLYVLDWYDRYHCYQDANRDPAGIERAKGRIYRVRYKDSPRAGSFDLAARTDEQLIELLGHANVYHRDQAQRLLTERLADRARPARGRLEQLVLSEQTPARQRMHALWVLAATSPGEELILGLLDCTDANVRAWGVRLAGNARAASPRLAGRLAQLAGDPSPDVRLQLVIAAGKIKDFQAAELLARVATHHEADPLLARIVWQNLLAGFDQRAVAFLRLLRETRIEEAPMVQALAPRLLDRMLADRRLNEQAVAQLFGMVRDAAPATARQCLANMAERVQSAELPKDAQDQLKAALEPVLAPLLANPATHPAGLDAALLAASWNDRRAVPYVRLTLETAGLDPELRLRALSALVPFADGDLLELAGQILKAREPVVAAPARPGQPPRLTSAEFRGRVIAALGRVNDPLVAEVVLAAYSGLEAEVQPRAVELLTQRAAWARKLLEAIGQKQIPAEALNLNQVRKLLATGDAELIKAVQRHWGTVREGKSDQREAVIARIRDLVRKNPGDAHRGQQVFDKVCGQCHKIYGKGEEVGPDITVNGRASFDQLLSNVLDPSLVIGAAYQARTVLTDSGRVVTGLLVEESPTRVVLKVQGGKLETFPRTQIEEFKTSELSLMPEDLEKTLKPEEIADLFAFLTLDRPPDDPRARRLPGTREVRARSEVEPAKFAEVLAEVAPGFTAQAAGEGGVALLPAHMGRELVVRTHPVSEKVDCVLSRSVELPHGAKAALHLAVSHDARGDWQLVVKVNGQAIHSQVVGKETTRHGWADLEIDLSKFAGQKVQIDLHNHANGWSWEFGYWGKAQVVIEDPAKSQSSGAGR